MTNPENLIPASELSPEKAREMGHKGGLASVRARREKKLLSQIYGEFLVDKLKIKMKDGPEIEIPANEYIKKCIIKGLDQKPSSMLREIREATEGSKLDITGQTIVVFDERFKKA